MLQIEKIIREERKKRGWTQYQMAKKAKISVGYFNRIENAQEDNISLEVLASIAAALSMTPSQLLTMAAKYEQEGGAVGDNWPIVGYVNAGKLKSEIEWNEKNLPMVGHSKFGSIAKAPDVIDEDVYCVIVADDSMAPIKKNSLLIISPYRPLDNADLVVADVNGNFLFREMRSNPEQDSFFILQTFSKHQDPLIVPKNEVKFLHKVCGHLVLNVFLPSQR